MAAESQPAGPARQRHQRLRIGIDTGGTFTDVVAYDEISGELAVTKTPTTPADPSIGFVDGLVKILDQLGTDASAVAAVSHGTTIATNQLLEGKIGRLGFITTAGFEFMLEIARQSVPDGYGNSYFWVKPDRIAPADLVKAVGGRLDHTGTELRPFDESGAVTVARWFRDRGIDTLGVCFLHSYANPEHERRMAAVLAREHPAAVVSLSSEVLREYREYERSVTTLLDASVKPRVSTYLGAISERLGWLAGRELPLHVMTSNGGVLSADEVTRLPISTVLSGPAAGALGAALIAKQAGITRVLTCDGGGTSTDVAVVTDGEPALTTEGKVGDYPSMIPMVDVVTVGAGGGSIAWVSPEGALKVGPRSAGADPGPICYGLGGDEVTVSDAHLVLGRIPPHLLGGEVPLDLEAAREGLAGLAAKLSLSEQECATGVLEVSAFNQANAVRQITVKRGLDVRDFTLVTFGGSGSLLLCPLIDILGISEVLVPQNPGNVSAFGLLTVDVRIDRVRTAVRRHDALDVAAVQEIFTDLEEQARQGLANHGFKPGAQRLIRTADLRYFGQAFEVRVPLPDADENDPGPGAPPAPFNAALAETVAARFHDAHRALYGYDFRGDARQHVEWVNLRVTGVGPLARPAVVNVRQGDGNPARARTGTRPVCFGRGQESVATAIFARSGLLAGDVINGPAVIEEYGATVPLHPGFRAAVDQQGNLRVSRDR
ncbi:MAG: hydantoinase/oxoprolinase family protein [Nocardiopsaceae bacterium]|jgi:N-methylhydantoinase A|nr:hydantoinase/oxoprolinase family protein [Nocardiopsaceae bacterium]